jgi:hypothetical protein
VPWSRSAELPLENAITLPAPGQSLFELPDGLRSALNGVARLSQHAEQSGSSAYRIGGRPGSPPANSSWRLSRGNLQVASAPGRDPRRGAAGIALGGRATAPAAAAHRGPQVKKKNV